MPKISERDAVSVVLCALALDPGPQAGPVTPETCGGTLLQGFAPFRTHLELYYNGDV